MTASGLSTSLMPYGPGALDVAFDFIDHHLTLRTTAGEQRRMRLEPRSVHDFGVSLVDANQVFARFRGEFRGKASPVHFFWGAFDLAVTRFSGRPAPDHPGGVPNCPDWVMQEAYCSEVSSCGYWPGGRDEGLFYSYAYPEPDGFRDAPLSSPHAAFDPDLGEFVLPCSAVRQAADPDTLLLSFLRETFDAAATGAQWPDPT